MLDIVRVCFRVRHILKQYFKLFILTGIRADGSKEKRIAKNAIRFSLRLKGEARVWLG